MKVQTWNVQVISIGIFLLIASCNASSINGKEKQKVCVIGAGVAGIAATKQLSDYADEFDIVVFEHKSDVGGQWIYTDNVDKDEHGLPVQSSIYKNLRTNTPKEIMVFQDYRPICGENRSSITHETVLEYLRNYTDHFNLRQYMQFETLVEKVTPILGDGDWRTTLWKVQTRNLNSNTVEVTTCNAVMVGVGRDTKPNIPKISGIETFPGKVIHSHVYRRPEYYAGKTVVVLGAGESGTDISVDISGFAKKIYLSHNHDKLDTPVPANLVQVAGVVAADGSELILKDGSRITADEMIYCTGYQFDFSFLDEQSKITVEKKRVKPLYKYSINMEHPSMSIFDHPHYGVWIDIFYAQAKYHVALLRGKIQLPTKEEMVNDTERLEEHRARSPDDSVWDYLDELLLQAGSEPFPPYYKEVYKIWFEYKFSDIINFKESYLRISDDGDITFIPGNRINNATLGN